MTSGARRLRQYQPQHSQRWCKVLAQDSSTSCTTTMPTSFVLLVCSCTLCVLDSLLPDVGLSLYKILGSGIGGTEHIVRKSSFIFFGNFTENILNIFGLNLSGAICHIATHSRFSTAILLGELCQFGPFNWKSLKSTF